MQTACDDPVQKGDCKGHFERYYHKDGVCESFIYTGCKGNDNNFETKEECENNCITKGKAPSLYPRH
ncbi:SPINT3 [Cordylochernes scorpioides]|uniref:SPINT3 n=1 Tax=Cordylochernes scorpioides TaxID=51811 RepID=A0ABY6LQB9_9ARAC|nr:SPINT3 [Cordylochernes scorpioides]